MVCYAVICSWYRILGITQHPTDILPPMRYHIQVYVVVSGCVWVIVSGDVFMSMYPCICSIWWYHLYHHLRSCGTISGGACIWTHLIWYARHSISNQPYGQQQRCIEYIYTNTYIRPTGLVDQLQLCYSTSDTEYPRYGQRCTCILGGGCVCVSYNSMVQIPIHTQLCYDACWYTVGGVYYTHKQ